jgi:dihydrofolate reductase
VHSTVRMIWAQARGGVLGADGALPWHLPEDLRLFKSLTTGATVVMGRRTWESLPENVRPLPGRRNVVLSSSLASTSGGVEVASSVDDVLAEHDDFWVIGGAGVYATFLPYATDIVRTEIDASFTGDTWAPELSAAWSPESRTPAEGWSESRTGLRYAVTHWRRELLPASGSG